MLLKNIEQKRNELLFLSLVHLVTVYEDLPDPWIPLTEHLFLWNQKLAQTRNFEVSQALCKHLGGSLPEPTSSEATQLLIIHMNYFQLDNGDLIMYLSIFNKHKMFCYYF